jgi:hypothetical protein
MGMVIYTAPAVERVKYPCYGIKVLMITDLEQAGRSGEV